MAKRKGNKKEIDLVQETMEDNRIKIKILYTRFLWHLKFTAVVVFVLIYAMCLDLLQFSGWPSSYIPFLALILASFAGYLVYEILKTAMPE